LWLLGAVYYLKLKPLWLNLILALGGRPLEHWLHHSLYYWIVLTV
jgi:hypothetical protein